YIEEYEVDLFRINFFHCRQRVRETSFEIQPRYFGDKILQTFSGEGFVFDDDTIQFHFNFMRSLTLCTLPFSHIWSSFLLGYNNSSRRFTLAIPKPPTGFSFREEKLFSTVNSSQPISVSVMFILMKPEPLGSRETNLNAFSTNGIKSSGEMM